MNLYSKYLEAGTYNRRTFARYDYRVGITVKPIDSKIRMWECGVSQNLSEDGISILHSKVLLPDETVYVQIPLFDSDDRVILKGQVAWVAVDDLYGDSPYWVKAGIRFDQLDTVQKNALHDALSMRKTSDITIPKKRPAKIDFVM